MTFHLVEFPAKTSSDDPAASSTLRAFFVLEQIAAADESLTLEELTRISGLPKPTVHRILRLLMRGGLVERQALDKRYVVGPRVSAMALAVQTRSPHRRRPAPRGHGQWLGMGTGWRERTLLSSGSRMRRPTACG